MFTIKYPHHIGHGINSTNSDKSDGSPSVKSADAKTVPGAEHSITTASATVRPDTTERLVRVAPGKRAADGTTQGGTPKKVHFEGEVIDDRSDANKGDDANAQHAIVTSPASGGRPPPRHGLAGSKIFSLVPPAAGQPDQDGQPSKPGPLSRQRK